MISHGTEAGPKTAVINQPATALIPARTALAGRTNTLMTMVFTLTFMLGSPTLAVAQSSEPGGHNEIYIEYSGGPSYFGNEELTAEDLPGATLTGRVNPEFGFNVGGAIGMRVHELIRTELQLGYRRSEVSGISLQGENDDGEGHFSLLSVMANAYVDYDLDIGIIPYAGVGIGWGLIDIDSRNPNSILVVDGDDAVFVWAVMVGGTVPVSDVVDISLGYRYIATTDPEFVSKVITTGTPGDPASSTRLDSEFDSHEAVLALRYKF